MSESLLDIHDGLLLSQPDGAKHDVSLCPFCTDWAMSESGTPSGFDRLDLADRSEPYGPVEYADPGLQEDKVKRYPIDTEAHATAAWTYIHQASNAKMYSEDQLAEIRTRISAAMEKHNASAVDQEVEKTKALAEAKNAGKPAAGAPAKKASSSTTKKTDAASEGGTNKHMDDTETISKETHEALLDKAVRDATATLTAERDAFKTQAETLTVDKASLCENLAAVKAENERLNGDLDTAQVSLKAASDEAASLKADMAAREVEAQKTQIASDRAAQVRNLGLFPEEYIADKASKWADVDEAAWTDRLDEWKALKGTSTATATTTDTASALSGTREGGTGHEPSARRAILGLA